jgi:hypothetical protein
LDGLLAGLGCRLTFSRSGCRDGQQLKSGIGIGVLFDERADELGDFFLLAAGQLGRGFKN